MRTIGKTLEALNTRLGSVRNSSECCPDHQSDDGKFVFLKNVFESVFLCIAGGDHRMVNLCLPRIDWWMRRDFCCPRTIADLGITFQTFKAKENSKGTKNFKPAIGSVTIRVPLHDL